MKNLIKRLRKRIKRSKGFTLVEVLFSILILMLSTTVILQCFNLGMGHFISQTRSSEAQLLCSALTSSLQNELTYARDIKITDGKLDTYFSSSRRMGEGSQIIVENGEVKIKIKGSTDPDDIYPLVASSNYLAKNRKGADGSGYFLKAYLKDNAITWDGTNNSFNITIWVDDANKAALTADEAEDHALAYSSFSVKPLATVR
jgi:type II secretory pathway pseudopilin PulG